jgi:hypothetical protein
MYHGFRVTLSGRFRYGLVEIAYAKAVGSGSKWISRALWNSLESPPVGAETDVELLECPAGCGPTMPATDCAEGNARECLDCGVAL